MPDRAALLTGASSGIGLAIAQVLAEEGHALTINARRPDKLDNAVAALRRTGATVEGVAGNMADEEDVKRAVEVHRAAYGRLDVLVNCAGLGAGAAVGDIDTRRADLQLDVNLRAPILLYRETVDLLKQAGAEHRNALVVNLSSISGKKGRAWLSVYSATKAGLIAFTQAMNEELGGGGHQVGRAGARLGRHAHVGLHQGLGQSRRDDLDARCRRGGAFPPEALTKLRDSGDRVPASDGVAVGHSKIPSAAAFVPAVG